MMVQESKTTICAGDEAPMRCSLHYAAPEVLQSYRSGKPIAASPSADIWALGVMAFEALTNTHVFPAFVSTSNDVYAAASGTTRYPWESQRGDARIVRLRVWPILAACLARDPAARPSAAQLLASLERAVNVTAVVEPAAAQLHANTS